MGNIIKPLYATDDQGRRIKRQALVTIPRKNGKTQLAAALALCHLVGPEAEPRGQVFSAASDRTQAALIMKEIVAFVRADKALSDRVIIREHSKTLEDVVTGSTYQALSSDAKKAHGLNVSFAVLDELAQWPKRDLYDALTTGGAARAEPLFVAISTQSHDRNHIMSELVQYGRRVLDGTIPDPTFLPVIYAAPDDADPWSEETWFACNPALGDFRSLDEMRAAADQAKALPAREPAFRLLYLNQPVDATTRFLNRRDWDACKGEVGGGPLFAGSALAGQRCILGLDLSSTTDLNGARGMVSADTRLALLVLDAARQFGGSRAARSCPVSSLAPARLDRGHARPRDRQAVRRASARRADQGFRRAVLRRGSVAIG